MMPDISHSICLMVLTVDLYLLQVKADLTMNCSSNKGAPNRCHFKGIYNTIQKDKQYSKSPCDLDMTYGLNANSIWVDNGCRARFLLTNTGNFIITTTESETTHQSTTQPDIETTTQIGPMITTSNTTTETTPSNHAEYCKCNCTIYYTETTLQSTIQKLKDELKVNKTMLSSTVRRKTSASDGRSSSKAIGTVGIMFLVFVFGSMVAMDFITIYTCIVRQ